MFWRSRVVMARMLNISHSLAYESNSVRKARRTIDLLGHCFAQLNREQGVGSFSHTLQGLLTRLRLRQRGLHPPSSSRVAFVQLVAAALVDTRRILRDALQLMHSERQAGGKTWFRNCVKIGRRCSIAGLKATHQHGAPYPSLRPPAPGVLWSKRWTALG